MSSHAGSWAFFLYVNTTISLPQTLNKTGMGEIAQWPHDPNKNRVGSGRDWVRQHFLSQSRKNVNIEDTVPNFGIQI